MDATGEEIGEPFCVLLSGPVPPTRHGYVGEVRACIGMVTYTHTAAPRTTGWRCGASSCLERNRRSHTRSVWTRTLVRGPHLRFPPQLPQTRLRHHRPQLQLHPPLHLHP
ncbi:hypothetical protein UPYG_G00321910, partial [Umbra pygmaea]